MRGPYLVPTKTKLKPVAPNLRARAESPNVPIKMDHILRAISIDLALPRDTKFHLVRSRPWSSIIEFTHEEKVLVAKVEHMPSELYFCFLKALPILKSDIVVNPVSFVEEKRISIFEIEQKMTLREGLRKGSQPFGQLEDVMFAYGSLQLDFAQNRLKNLPNGCLFAQSRKPFEEAVLAGAASADKILNFESGRLRNQARSLLRSNQFRELPDTILHTDLHDGNIFSQNERWRIGDWSELLIGPIGVDIMLFFHAVSIAHPLKPMPELVAPAFSSYMEGVGDLLVREQWLSALESGRRLLPAIQLSGLLKSKSSNAPRNSNGHL